MHDDIKPTPIPIPTSTEPTPLKATPLRPSPSPHPPRNAPNEFPKTIHAVAPGVDDAAVQPSRTRGRPPSGKTSAVKCIYFSDVAQLEQLEALARKYPRSSVSSLITQMTDILLRSVAQDPDKHIIRIDTEFYL